MDLERFLNINMAVVLQVQQPTYPGTTQNTVCSLRLLYVQERDKLFRSMELQQFTFAATWLAWLTDD